MTTRQRRDLANQVDQTLASFFNAALQDSFGDKENHGISIVAVGGYGRGELSPGSDIDITILHSGKKKLANQSQLDKFVQNFLYPIWNTNWKVDHSVRTLADSLTQAESDLRVMLGLLDARLVIGESSQFEELSRKALILWRKRKDKFLPELIKSLEERRERSGNCAFLLEPDIKEARGGLRDINIISTLTKLYENPSEVPIALDRLAIAGSTLNNIRDELHRIHTPPRDLLLFSLQDQLAPIMGYEDADALLLEVAKSARLVNYLMQLTLHRLQVDQMPKSKLKPEVVAPGIEIIANEVVITHFADSEIGLKAAAIAASRGLPLNSESCIKLVENFQPLPNPWPRNVREDFVTLLGAGRWSINVFESLDQEGLIEKWIPEWSHLRYLPQRNALHRHNVDRHSLETAVFAAELTRTVRRPDLLLVGALFHDLGKGFGDLDHSIKGEELIGPVALRMGFKAAEVKTLQLLVREHLTLSSIATRRDIDDPATLKYLEEIIPDLESLNLLHALSIADGQATGKAAWSDWKAKLVATLVNSSAKHREGVSPNPNFEISAAQNQLMLKKEFHLSMKEFDDNFEIEVISPDRTGLLSSVAGAFTVLRGEIRSAKTKTIGDMAIMKWIVAFDALSPIPSVNRISALVEDSLNGVLDLGKEIEVRRAHFRSFPGIKTAPPIVYARNDQATNATLLEIRMHDQPGLLYLITKTLSRFSVDIKGALVSTLGAEALDTLYLTDLADRPLTQERAIHLASQLENYLATQ